MPLPRPSVRPDPPAAAPAPVTVALVEDDAGTRARFESVIRANPHLKLVHSAAWARDMLGWLAEHAVDVLLVDLGLPDGSGIDIIARRLPAGEAATPIRRMLRGCSLPVPGGTMRASCSGGMSDGRLLRSRGL